MCVESERGGRRQQRQGPVCVCGHRAVGSCCHLVHQQDDPCSYHLSPACLSYRQTQDCLAPRHCLAVGQD